MDDDPEEPTVLTNENPHIISGGYAIVTGFLQSYGWFVLLGIIVLLYIKQKLSPVIESMKKKMEDDSAKKKYDPEVAHRRLESLDNARRRLQEKHDVQANKYAEEQKIKEEEKRKEKIEDWERHQEGKGYRSKVKSKEEEPKQKKKSVLRPKDYNPLMGTSSGSASYRPPRRGGGGG